MRATKRFKLAEGGWGDAGNVEVDAGGGRMG